MELISKTTVYAPDLDGGLAWFNTASPLSMKALRGNIVLLDFWTYCCINCMHVLPVLRAVEEHFAGEPLVVIGVHSGKFTTEEDPAHIREAIGRYDVAHPVVVDDRMAIWSRFAVRSWPTLIVVRPDGTIAAIAPGEPDLDTLVTFIQRELDRARAKGSLAAGPPEGLRADVDQHTLLRYPGKVMALPDGRLVISDSGHHRVLVTSEQGEVEHVVGSGLAGLSDGPFETAAFDDPQGVAWHDGYLYVADTRNHAVRRIDLEKRVVERVAGTGELGVGPPLGVVDARKTPLRSPWDLASVGDVIYIAMAGSHQLWRFSPAQETLEVYAGTGVEALIDGPVERSAWAQPSGMAVRGDRLFVADSETSAVRSVQLSKGEVETRIGEGLFDFGDEDGAADQAMLQHPLDVAVLPDGSLLVADTYNGKLKRIAGEGPESRATTVLEGLSEPGGVAVLPDGSWLVADTNAHRILRVERGQAHPIPIVGAPPARRGVLTRKKPRGPAPSVDGWFTTLLDLPTGQGLRPGSGALRFTLRHQPSPSSTVKLAPGAPIAVRAEVSRRSDLLLLPKPFASIEPRVDDSGVVAASLDVDVTSLPDSCIEAELVLAIDYLVCASGDQSACFPRSAHVRVPVRLLEATGSHEVSFGVDLPAD